MSEPHKSPPARKTAAVTISGVLFLLLAAFCAFIADFATQGHFRDALVSGVFLVAAIIFGYAGLAIIRRWRGWRIWAGTLAWGLIAFIVLSVFRVPVPPGSRVMFALIIAFAVFVLVAMRREREPDLAAVFGD